MVHLNPVHWYLMVSLNVENTSYTIETTSSAWIRVQGRYVNDQTL